MSSPTRRGGIPGPESRTGLTRPSMTEAEFERRLGTQAGGAEAQTSLVIGNEPADGVGGTETEVASRAASARAALLLPAPAGPSMVMIIVAHIRRAGGVSPPWMPQCD